jgi:anaerobic selenocysteine-containing dehydrogenase
MSDQRMLDHEKQVDRRGFLKGSAIFAAGAGLAVALPASAQEPAKPEAPVTKEEPKKEEPGAGEQGGDKKAKLYDKQGREYRVCDMCGGNLYVTEKMWTCEQCGFAYEV